MSVIAIPRNVGFSKVDKLQLLRAGLNLRSRYTGKRQVINFPFAAWVFEGSLIPMEGADANDWRRFLLGLEGMKNTFRLPVPGSSLPLSGYGSSQVDSIVNGAASFPTSWVPSASATVTTVTGRMRVTTDGTAQAFATQAIKTVPGATYVVTADVVAGTAADGRIAAGTAPNAANLGVKIGFGIGQSFTFTAVGTTTYILCYLPNTATATQYTDFDNITAVGLPGATIGTGGVAARATSAPVKGIGSVSFLKAGDYFNIGDELKVAMADCDLVAGVGTVSFQPPTRKAYVSGDDMTLVNPFIYLAMADADGGAWALDRPVKHGIKLTCMEAIE